MITYRLHRPGKNYDGLYEGIKGISGTYWHNTTSSWIVQTSMSPKKVFETLNKHIDNNDELAVFRLEGAYYGQLQTDDHTWLQSMSEMYRSTT